MTVRDVKIVHRKISMKQIETLVFNYGGVIGNIDEFRSRQKLRFQKYTGKDQSSGRASEIAIN